MPESRATLSGMDDLIIIGAGFAGLACARNAALRGLKVRVLERKAHLRQGLHTTGILVQEAHDWLTAHIGEVPQQLRLPVAGVRLYAPSRKSLQLSAPGYRFFTTDTGGLLEWMAQEAILAGVSIEYDTRFEGLRAHEAAGVTLTDGSRARWLIGADGARSRVAAAAGLSRNERFLVGAEVELDGACGRIAPCLHVFIDAQIAPGYIAWVCPAPNGLIQVGVARADGNTPAVSHFIESISPIIDLRGARIVERRGGLIPVGGRLARIADGRVLLTGDAAGLVSPLTAGGIHYALRAGHALADVIADFEDAKGAHPVQRIVEITPSFRAKALAHRAYAKAASLPSFNRFADKLLSMNALQGAMRRVFYHR